MTQLVLGVLLWSLTHLVPALFPGLRDSMARKLGENGFKGIFTLLMIAAILISCQSY